ncbi:unnamed protein product [Amoebophrya sp. A120]|nr:unnamed protein product [Amoebophrya sp. A120]|eukprot:GSA120T00002875001.1
MGRLLEHWLDVDAGDLAASALSFWTSKKASNFARDTSTDHLPLRCGGTSVRNGTGCNRTHFPGRRTTSFAYNHGFINGDTWTPAKRPPMDEMLALSKKKVATLQDDSITARPTPEEKALEEEAAHDRALLGTASLQDKYGPILKAAKLQAIAEADGDATTAQIPNMKARVVCSHFHHGHDSGDTGESKILEVRLDDEEEDAENPAKMPWIPCTRWYGADNIMKPSCMIEMDVRKNSAARPTGEEMAKDDLAVIVDHKTRFVLENFEKVDGIENALKNCPEPADESLFFNACPPPDLQLACNCSKSGHEQVWAKCANPMTKWVKCDVGGVTRMELGPDEDTQPGSVTCTVHGRVVTMPYLKGPMSTLAPFYDYCKDECGPVGREKHAVIDGPDIDWEVRKAVASCPAKKLSLKCKCSGKKFASEANNVGMQQMYEATCGELPSALECTDHKMVNNLHTCKVFVNRVNLRGPLNNLPNYRPVVTAEADTEECDSVCPSPDQLGVKTQKEAEQVRKGLDPDTGDVVNAEKKEAEMKEDAQKEQELDKDLDEKGVAEMNQAREKLSGPTKDLSGKGDEDLADDDDALPPDVAEA